MQTFTATYSPDDNKLRLYASSRLDAELYARVKSAGFSWAPKQELFVAPMWTPSREDLLIELAGEVGDEDTSLAQRAEQRAERFDDYSDKRAGDAERARDAVSAIADSIPFGQPILVGHHSERHARRDAERIRSGMARAVKMWETSEYWAQRAAGAIRAAKYKERPDVRARRIKKIEADRRKVAANVERAQKLAKLWGELENDSRWPNKTDGTPPTVLERAQWLANRDYFTAATPEGHPHGFTAYDVLQPDDRRYSACPSMTPQEVAAKAIALHNRYIAHAARWLAHYDNRLAYERAFLADAGGIETDRTKPEKGGAVRCWASPGHGRGWSYIQKANRVTVTVLDNWGNGGRNFTRTIPFDKLRGVMSAAEVQAKRAAGELQETSDGLGFYLLDTPPTEPKPEMPTDARGEQFDAMRDSLAAGVKVAAVPQLFPTPEAIADRMAELAELSAAHEVLEPSAGTGALVDAVARAGGAARVFMVERDGRLAEALSQRYTAPDATHCRDVLEGDFLDIGPDQLGRFDRVLMNPPFANAADIQHIMHARRMLKPGGRLVAICANGPRQNEQLRPIAAHWEALPAGTFAGTGVSAALLVIDANA